MRAFLVIERSPQTSKQLLLPGHADGRRGGPATQAWRTRPWPS